MLDTKNSNETHQKAIIDTSIQENIPESSESKNQPTTLQNQEKRETILISSENKDKREDVILEKSESKSILKVIKNKLSPKDSEKQESSKQLISSENTGKKISTRQSLRSLIRTSPSDQEKSSSTSQSTTPTPSPKDSEKQVKINSSPSTSPSDRERIDSRKLSKRPIKSNKSILHEDIVLIKPFTFENLFSEQNDERLYRRTAAFTVLCNNSEHSIKQLLLCVSADKFDNFWLQVGTQGNLYIQKEILLLVQQLIDNYLAQAYKNITSNSLDTYKEIQVYIQNVVSALCEIDFDSSFEWLRVGKNQNDSPETADLACQLSARRYIETLFVDNLPEDLKLAMQQTFSSELDKYHECVKKIFRLKITLNNNAMTKKRKNLNLELIDDQCAHFKLENFISTNEIIKQFKQVKQGLTTELALLKNILNILKMIHFFLNHNKLPENLLIARGKIPKLLNHVTILDLDKSKIYCQQINLEIASIVCQFIHLLTAKEMLTLKGRQQEIMKESGFVPLVLDKILWLKENLPNSFSLPWVISLFSINNPSEIKIFNEEMKILSESSKESELNRLRSYYKKEGMSTFCFTDPQLVKLIQLYCFTADKELQHIVFENCVKELENPKPQISSSFSYKESKLNLFPSKKLSIQNEKNTQDPMFKIKNLIDESDSSSYEGKFFLNSNVEEKAIIEPTVDKSEISASNYKSEKTEQKKIIIKLQHGIDESETSSSDDDENKKSPGKK